MSIEMIEVLRIVGVFAFGCTIYSGWGLWQKSRADYLADTQTMKYFTYHVWNVGQEVYASQHKPQNEYFNVETVWFMAKADTPHGELQTRAIHLANVKHWEREIAPNLPAEEIAA